MRTFCLVFFLLLLVTSASAKPIVQQEATGELPSRQGGDTVGTAFRITTLPFYDTGTTSGYTFDYYGFCPYPESGMAPDVCYVYSPQYPDVVSIDLLGSSYDTTLLTYEIIGSNLVPLVCNDDFYPDNTSRIENMQFSEGSTYLIVVSGYLYASGNYVLNIAGETVSTAPMSWENLKSLYR